MHLLRAVYHLDLFEERDSGGEHEICREGTSLRTSWVCPDQIITILLWRPVRLQATGGNEGARRRTPLAGEYQKCGLVLERSRTRRNPRPHTCTVLFVKEIGRASCREGVW